MKLLYIANVRIPTEKAHGLQIMMMCENFSLAGASVELIIPSRINKDLKNIDPFVFYDVKSDFKIKKIRSLDPTFLFKFPPGFYIKVQSFFYILFKQ